MKTIRAFFWGSVIGSLIGYLFVPQRSEMMREELMASQGQTSGESGANSPRVARSA